MITTLLLIQSLSTFLITWLLTHVEWYTNFMDWLFEKLFMFCWKSPLATWLLNQAYILVGCPKCLAFWTILIMTWNPILAIGVAYIANLSQLIENKLKK